MSRQRRIGIALIVVAAIVLVGAILRTANARNDRAALIQADPEKILADTRLSGVARDIGSMVFARDCASCHGPTGAGDRRIGAPDLTDGERLYGSGLVGEIEQIVLHGIRSGDPKGWNLASMPAFASAKPYAAEPIPPLRPGEIGDVVAYLRALHGDAGDAAAVARGKALYLNGGACWDCHGRDAGGDPSIGAPDLLDDVWIYGDGSAASLERSIAYGRAGIMPRFAHRLTPVEARAVAAYTAMLSHPSAGIRR